MLTLIFGFLIGTVLGSFAKALADRSLTERSFWGRSRCEHCHKQLQASELVPIVSFLLLRGKCRYCHKKIGSEYLIVELVVGLLVAGLLWVNGGVFSALVIYQMFFITILVAIFLTDLRETLIPDRIVYPALLIGLVSRVILGNWQEPLIGAALIGGFFLSLVLITRGKGMGGGDIKLGAFMGLSLGIQSGVLAVTLAFLTGAGFALLAISLGKKRFGESLPFGPFLVVGSLTALYWGREIMQLYLGYV